MNKGTMVIIGLLVIVALGVRCFTYFYSVPQFKDGQALDLTGVIKNQPKIVGNKQKFTFSAKGNLFLITTNKNPEYWYGQRLQVDGVMTIFTAGKAHLLILSYPKIQATYDQSWLAIWSQHVRSHVGKAYGVLPSNMAGLLIGMVFGVQQDMSADFLNSLKMTGVTHIIAASGMNISLIAGGLLSILQKFLNRRLAIVLSLIGIFAYTALAGFQPSIIRAALMGALTLTAGLFGRQSLSMIGLIGAAVLMLLINPNWLFDIGFQLSFMATAGIFMIKPQIDYWLLGLVKKENVLLVDLSTTIAAQLTTLPILMTNFGYFNPFSIVINLLVLWTVPPVMLIGGLAAVISYLSLPLAQVISYLSYPLLWYFSMVVNLGNKLTGVLKMSEVPIIIQLGYYCLIGGMVTLRRKSL